MQFVCFGGKGKPGEGSVFENLFPIQKLGEKDFFSKLAKCSIRIVTGKDSAELTLTERDHTNNVARYFDP